MGKATKKLKKITPFKYPSKKHVRTEFPPVMNDYGKYKPFLQRDFNNKCVYCRKSDTRYLFVDKATFQVEHYRPKSKFPELTTDYKNLLYACRPCNGFKRSYWSDDDQRKVLNPCDHIMSHHLAFDLPKVTSR